jgi:hypothetical protein
MRASASIVVMLALAAGLMHACAEGGAQACAPGDYRYCDCAAGPRGYALCADDGSAYGACDCSGKIPAGAGVLVEAGVPDAAPAATSAAGFLAPCNVDADCTTKRCFPFNAYGPHCSQACNKDIDCPPPSPGCSNMKVCKLH